MSVYSYQTIDPSTNEANGTRFFKLMKTMLGNDFQQWYKHEDLPEALYLAHHKIFKDPKPFKVNGGLKLLLCFLDNAEKRTKETKLKRKNMYHDAMLYALLADVIDTRYYLEHRVIG